MSNLCQFFRGGVGGAIEGGGSPYTPIDSIGYFVCLNYYDWHLKNWSIRDQRYIYHAYRYSNWVYYYKYDTWNYVKTSLGFSSIIDQPIETYDTLMGWLNYNGTYDFGYCIIFKTDDTYTPYALACVSINGYRKYQYSSSLGTHGIKYNTASERFEIVFADTYYYYDSNTLGNSNSANYNDVNGFSSDLHTVVPTTDMLANRSTSPTYTTYTCSNKLRLQGTPSYLFAKVDNFDKQWMIFYENLRQSYIYEDTCTYLCSSALKPVFHIKDENNRQYWANTNTKELYLFERS